MGPELFGVFKKLTESSSIYRILLNCKSSDYFHYLKPKLKYGVELDERRGDDVSMDEVVSGLGALFAESGNRRSHEDDDESEERALSAFGALFG